MSHTAPSDHLGWDELACHDEARTPYPERWRDSRAVDLARMFEAVRAELGGTPLTILSGYRTEAHNRKVGGAPNSQHVQGRAIDISHGIRIPREVYTIIWALASAGKLPWLGGIGRYETFVHIDCRPRRPGTVPATWVGGMVDEGGA